MVRQWGDMIHYQLGIYEKALPPDHTWQERLMAVKEAGFDFLELSIDESDERQSRWTGACSNALL